MDLGRRIGWGVAIYAIVFLVWAGNSIYGWMNNFGAYLFYFLVLLIACLWAGSQLKFRNWKDMLPYSIGWAVIAAALDGIYVVPLQGWGWYQQWQAWSLYVLIVLLPLLSSHLRKSAAAPSGPWES
ncbi:MAG: hypothetical protein P4L81_04420 [Candidatus Pacebacteria bacterium]|nr:hypothetical protein [Candidatus Paceibacterota bacterium]